MFVDSMESGTGAQTVTGDADSTDNKARLTRDGDTAEPLFEQVHTVLADEAQDAVGTFPNCLGVVEDVSAVPQPGGRT